MATTTIAEGYDTDLARAQMEAAVATAGAVDLAEQLWAERERNTELERQIAWMTSTREPVAP